MSAQEPTWPQNADEWRLAIHGAVGVTPEEGDRLFRTGELPRQRLLDWLAAAYGPERGYHPDFVPALTRNVDGLLRWAYGGGPEPFWPGHDEDW